MNVKVQFAHNIHHLDRNLVKNIQRDLTSDPETFNHVCGWMVSGNQFLGLPQQFRG